MKTKLALLTAVTALLLLSGCADKIPVTHAHEIAGFWHGLWHGMILPFAWLVSLFDSDVAVYAIYNNGGWYNFGFVLGVGGLASGSTSGRSKS